MPMNAPRKLPAQRGFTLMELMVAMTITTIIVTVLVSITAIAMDTWNRSRAELRAARQASAMVDTMARDFESLVTRSGNTNEWLSAISSQSLPGKKLKSTNAAELIFFSAATDRYEGEIGINNNKDKGGDVSCVSYRLLYKDPIANNGTDYQTFVLNRLLVNPDSAFNDLLGKANLTTAFAAFADKIDSVDNFVCENVFQFTVTFNLEVTRTSTGTSTPTLINVPVTIGQASSGQVTDSLKINGTGIVTQMTSGNVSADELKAARITSIQVSLTVISDFGIDQLRSRPFTDAQKADFLAKNSFEFTKLVTIPSR